MCEETSCGSGAVWNASSGHYPSLSGTVREVWRQIDTFVVLCVVMEGDRHFCYCAVFADGRRSALFVIVLFADGRRSALFAIVLCLLMEGDRYFCYCAVFDDGRRSTLLLLCCVC